MKKMLLPNVFLGIGMAAFLLTGCEQATEQSGSQEKSSPEGAIVKGAQNGDDF